MLAGPQTPSSAALSERAALNRSLKGKLHPADWRASSRGHGEREGACSYYSSSQVL